MQENKKHFGKKIIKIRLRSVSFERSVSKSKKLRPISARSTHRLGFPQYFEKKKRKQPKDEREKAIQIVI